MPRKTRITREAILDSAFKLTREHGINYVTAKSLATDLHCSTQPIYWVFDNMGSLKKEVVRMANDLYNVYFHKEHENLNRLKSVGVNYILFAKEEPNLFRLLFVTDREKDTSIFKSTLDDNKNEYISYIEEDLHFTEEQANQYYVSLWIFTHGIATMIVTDLTAFTNEEIGNLLTEVSKAVISRIREGAQ